MNTRFQQYAPPGTRLLLASSFLATVPLGYLIVVLPLHLARAGIEPAVIGGFYTTSGAMTARSSRSRACSQTRELSTAALAAPVGNGAS